MTYQPIPAHTDTIPVFDLDAEWALEQLRADAATVTQMVLNGMSDRADQYLTDCNYTARLTAFKQAHPNWGAR